ncbi:hypothetical protein JNN96_17730 [Mycobacterium sp. DSM 3803]|nr:hypothetical protein [Mycobacterium sp. DSM 3803]
MQVAARSYLAAGAALVGASAMAISPVAPPLPDIDVPAVSSVNVSLSAAVDPIEAYIQLIGNTITNVGTTIETELADPAPVLQQLIANQLITAQALATGLQGAGEGLINQLDPANPYGIPAGLQQALTHLLEGDVNAAVSAAWGALLSPVLNVGLPLLEPTINAIKQPVQNLLNVLNNPLVVLMPVLGALNVAYTTVTVTGNVGQDIVDSVKEGDPLGVVNAMLGGPARITDAFLNGNELGGGVFGPNLGLLSALRQAREALAAAITPPAADVNAVTAAPDTAAATVTLDVSPQSVQTPAESSTVSTADTTPTSEAAASNESGAAATGTAAGTEGSTTSEAESESTSTSTAGSTTVVKDSIKAEPGKTDTSVKSSRTNPLKQVRNDIRDTVRNVTDGLKKAAEGLTGKPKNPKAKTDSPSGSTSSGESAGSSSSSSGSSGSSSNAA